MTETRTTMRDRLRALAGHGAATASTRMGAHDPARSRMVTALLRVGLVGALLLAAVNPALAQDLSPISTMLTNVLTALTGPIGIALAGLGLVGCGMLCIMGRLNAGWFGAVFLGVVMIFSADTIVTGFNT